MLRIAIRAGRTRLLLLVALHDGGLLVLRGCLVKAEVEARCWKPIINSNF